MKNIFTKIQNIGIQSVIKNENNQYLFLYMKNKIKAFKNNKLINDNYNLEFYNEYSIDDEILNFHVFNNYVLLIGKSNKKIVLFNQTGEKLKEFVHYKKLTNSILFLNEPNNYLLLSDKFGEIYYKNISIEKFDEPPKILYGHSDPIHFMRVSPSGKMIATADTLGKIKIVEFPNIYNMLTVLLYDNEDIKFCDFINNQNLIVINSNYEIHIWSLNDFQLKSKFDLKTLLDIKIENRQESQGINEEDGNKKDNENQENINFCNEDEIISNIFYVNGNRIIIQTRDTVRYLKEEDSKKRFINFSLSDSDEISLVSSHIIDKIQTDDNTFLFISEDTKEILFLKHNFDDTEKPTLNVFCKFNFDQVQV